MLITHTRMFEVFLGPFFCWGRSEMKVSPRLFSTWGYSSSNTPSLTNNPWVFGWGPPVLQQQRAAAGQFRTLVYRQNQCGCLSPGGERSGSVWKSPSNKHILYISKSFIHLTGSWLSYLGGFCGKILIFIKNQLVPNKSLCLYTLI